MNTEQTSENIFTYKVQQILYLIKGWVKLVNTVFLNLGWMKQMSIILTIFPLHPLIQLIKDQAEQAETEIKINKISSKCSSQQHQ